MSWVSCIQRYSLPTRRYVFSSITSARRLPIYLLPPIHFVYIALAFTGIERVSVVFV
jgi:hypothetical protein